MRGRKPTTELPERKTVGYVRVSTQEQAASGVSLDAQEAKIAAYCLAMDWELSEIVRDAGESAKSLKRPGIHRIIEGVRGRTIGRVVILKLDRATRSTRDLASLLEVFARADASLVSVTESLDTRSAAGRLVVNMLGVVAQWEREAIGERTATALAHKRQRRQAYGLTPFGYRREGNVLLPDLAQQSALREAKALQDAGASLRQIGGMLSAMGVMPHRSKTWHAASVRAVLRSRIANEGVF